MNSRPWLCGGLAATAIAACGGTTPATAPGPNPVAPDQAEAGRQTRPPPPPVPTRADLATAYQGLCAHIGALHAGGDSTCRNLDPRMLEPTSCEAFIGAEPSPDPLDDDGLDVLDRVTCWTKAPACSEFRDCRPAARRREYPDDRPVCERRAGTSGPYWLSAAQAAARPGVGLSRLDQVRSSKAAPLEVCALAGELDWLQAATCADGSHPFASGEAAHDARVGAVGVGGRCGATVIDHYAITCPEATYDVYLDMYHCGPGETW